MILGRRLADLAQRLSDSLFKSVPLGGTSRLRGSIATTLTTPAATPEGCLRPGARHPLITLTHEQLAALAGTSRATCTRVLHEFAAHGLLRLARGRNRVAPGVPEAVMELTVLVVPECPHTGLLRDPLNEALANRPDVTVTWREITDPQEAETAGMHRSPPSWRTELMPSPRPANRPTCPAESATRRQWTRSERPSPTPALPDLTRTATTQPPALVCGYDHPPEPDGSRQGRNGDDTGAPVAPSAIRCGVTTT